MTIHIEHVVTEVITESEPSETREANDQRWIEQEKIKATLARFERQYLRLHAEGLDD